MKKEDKQKIKEKTRCRGLTLIGPQKAHPTGEFLLLWHKMVTVHRFVWPLALQLWSVRQAVRLKFEFWQYFKILYPAICYGVPFMLILMGQFFCINQHICLVCRLFQNYASFDGSIAKIDSVFVNNLQKSTRSFVTHKKMIRYYKTTQKHRVGICS